MELNRMICLLGLMLIFSACSNTKHLSENQNLYVGADIKIHSSEKLSKSKKNDLKDELSDLLRPKPNSKILGIRFKLWIYNLAGKPTGHGLRYWLKNKVGEPPVIASMSALEKNSEVLQNRLENRGYFHDSVTLDTIVKKKKLKAIYTADIGAQYTIRNISFPSDSSVLSNEIQKATRWSLLKPKNPYDLDVIKKERERIDSRLKQRGFFYFNPDYLIVNVDSTVGNHQVDMNVRVKIQTPKQAREVYKINDVIVFADYDINSDTSIIGNRKLSAGNYTIIDPKKLFQPKIFDRTLVFKPGDIYKRNDHNLSLNRLTSLGVFKFVKARFEPVDTMKGNYLNAFYYLTPTEKKSIRLEVSALTKSDNANGTQIALNWRNRNLLKGAELFTASIYGGFEKQISGTQNANINRTGVDLNLYIPRIISPFNFRTNSGFVPKTRINTGFEVYNQSAQYTLTSIRGSYGYQWKEDIRKEHQLNIININYVQPAHITPEYQKVIDTNIVLRRSIERQFIIGSNYNFNYNTQVVPNFRKNNFYFNGNLDLSGNLLGLITGANVNKGKEKSIFNTPFSQYTRLELELRHYLRLGTFRSLNTRLLGGVGYAYGNSTTMPFVKEFFAGGTNDIRAFRARSLGPGSYYAGNPDTARFYVDQPGDIKLEMNLEYRAKLFSIVRWAVFADAGNVWTRHTDSSRAGAKFTSNFLNQVAVGVGAGLRFDISILVLRVDLAFPIRKPYMPEGSKWVLDKIDFTDKQWRKDNLILNLAIGYPF